MNSVAAISLAALIALIVMLTGLTGLTTIPAEGYAGLSLLLTGFAVTAWGREEQELAATLRPAQSSGPTSPAPTPAGPAGEEPGGR